jgi:hypothetical protein
VKSFSSLTRKVFRWPKESGKSFFVNKKDFPNSFRICVGGKHEFPESFAKKTFENVSPIFAAFLLKVVRLQ